ncbi:hypothetical protein PVAP13_5KG393107 [Panicum virgatum]|uniref:Uncharacterized protein n=1 Tax=Panicum virgatum TaxID=38727 RepID=A0A8T0SNW9_PANVG|nr:hypothetical protein PVAP13_5KG393107 [Panicum virgatum]
MFAGADVTYDPHHCKQIIAPIRRRCYWGAVVFYYSTRTMTVIDPSLHDKESYLRREIHG